MSAKKNCVLTTTESRGRFSTSKMHLSPLNLPVFLLLVALIICGHSVFGPCFLM